VSSILVRKSDDGTRDSLTWRWRGGGETMAAELGDPLGQTNYAICLYDRSVDVPSLAVIETAPAGSLCGGDPCWRLSSRGVKYKDKEPATHGLFAITVSVIPEKRTSFKVKVMGDRLHLPPPANAFQLFRQHSNVLVQLVNSDDHCWETTFPVPAQTNTVEKFKDRIP